jgi:hypothetical protein
VIDALHSAALESTIADLRWQFAPTLIRLNCTPVASQKSAGTAH